MRVARFIGRGFWVTLLVAFHAVVWLCGWLALLVALRGKPARQAWFASRLVALLIGLGATFIKVGQIMSTRPDLFAPHIIRALTRLQDNVGAFPWARVERVIAGELGKPPDELFATFERTPVASASVAQVHRATLHTGEEVAVKVRRPGLDELVAFDLAVLRLVARIVAVVPSIRLLAPVESVDQFGAAIRAQIDLRIEAENNRRFTANFAGDPDIAFPKLHEPLCGRCVLTMTFIHGVKILDAPTKLGIDGSRLAKIGFRILLKMVFADGFVHADLHPGNILVDDAGKVILLDLGLTAELDPAARRGFVTFFAGWASADGAAMAKLMLDLSPSAKVVDRAAFERDVDAFARRFLGKPFGEIQISDVVFHMIEILRRHRVRMNPTYTMCNIAMAVTEGIGKQLDPKLDLLEQAQPFFVSLGALTSGGMNRTPPSTA